MQFYFFKKSSSSIFFIYFFLNEILIPLFKVLLTFDIPFSKTNFLVPF